MINQTKNIIRSLEKKDKYNILTFDTHERYQTQLCKTGHNFYSFRYENCKEWNTNYAEFPSNYYVLPKHTIPNGVEIDLILSQSKFGQFQMCSKIVQNFRVPLVSLEHTLPIPNWPEQQLEGFRRMVGDVNVFISEYSANEWNMNCDAKIIHHCVDTELFSSVDQERDKVVLSVANDFINRDYCLNYSGWQRITQELPTKVIGDTPGLSEAAKSTEDLVEAYQKSLVFLNTSTISPVPTSLLEAMSCGCAVVSTATCMIPEIIENGVNGFISNDEEELKSCIKDLLDKPEMAKQWGENARNTILEKFSEDKFINNWNDLFDLAYRMGT